jgi:hypothetical protein
VYALDTLLSLRFVAEEAPANPQTTTARVVTAHRGGLTTRFLMTFVSISGPALTTG